MDNTIILTPPKGGKGKLIARLRELGYKIDNSAAEARVCVTGTLDKHPAIVQMLRDGLLRQPRRPMPRRLNPVELQLSRQKLLSVLSLDRLRRKIAKKRTDNDLDGSVNWRLLDVQRRYRIDEIEAVEEIVRRIKPDATPELIAAVACYYTRKERLTNTYSPEGYWRGDTWHPYVEEKRPCCADISYPSARFPYSLLRHCCTVNHVAALYGVKAADLRRLYLTVFPADNREGGDNYYKTVALLDDGRMVSLYDATTEYVLDRQIQHTARQGHVGGLYCYRTQSEAERVSVRVHPNLHRCSRVILRVKAEGAYCVYDSGKLAFSRLTPLEVVAVQSATSTAMSV